MMKLPALFRGPIRRQLILGVALVHALLMTFFVWDLVNKHEQAVYDQARQQIRHLGETLADTLALWLAAHDVQAIQDALDAQKRRVPNLIEALVFDMDGRIVAHTERRHVGQYVADPLSLQLLKASPRYQLLYEDARLLDAAAPVTLRGQPLGWVRLRMDVSALHGEILSIIVEGVFYTLFAIVVGSLLAWWLGQRLTRRLYQLQEVARQVTNGARDVRFPTDSGYRDEVETLGEYFNAMLDQLRANELALTREHDRIQKVLRLVPVGIVLFDRQGRLVYANPAFERMAGMAHLQPGEPFATVFGRVHIGDRRLFGFGELLQHAGQRLEDVRFQPNEEMSILASLEAVPYGHDNDDGLLLIIEPEGESEALLRRLLWDQLHDPVTGLPNRTALLRHLEECYESGEAEHGCLWAMNVDHFRQVNEVFGLSGGDEMLARIAERLTRLTRDLGQLYHLGGDGFALLLPRGMADPVGAAERLIHRFEQSVFMLHGQKFALGLTLVQFELRQFDYPEALLLAMDAGMRTAKQSSRGRAVRYTTAEDVQARKLDEVRWLGEIKNALQQRSLQLVGQPLVPLDGRSERRLEILVRLPGEDGRPVPPGVFLPIAERYGLMHALDMTVLDLAVDWLRVHEAQVDRINLNLSGQTLASELNRQDLIERLSAQPRSVREALCIEVTETVAVGDMRETARLLQQIRSLGCRVAIDDFGSGYASFNYLKGLSVDEVKIDGAFVREMMTSEVDAAMVAAVVEIAHKMQLGVVAEFVETAEMARRLQKLGVEYAQGYYFSAPQPLEALDETFWQKVFALRVEAADQSA